MKYLHSYHAGNFADVHKHVALLALLAALKRKEKGFLYLETHAGRGRYTLSPDSGEARTGIERLSDVRPRSAELRAYLERISVFRKAQDDPHAYPGSPLLAAGELRPQDRAVLVESQASEARALSHALEGMRRARVECGDGFDRLRAHLPPHEKRALTLIDPPYEETRQDFERVMDAFDDALRRFPTGVLAAWYPIKDARDTAGWHAGLAKRAGKPLFMCELWLYPPDSRVGLNGSGLVIANPPYRFAEQVEEWLQELHGYLDTGHGGGCRSGTLA